MEISPSVDPAQAATEFAEANEMILCGEPVIADQYVFLRVDPMKTDLVSFYSWKEVSPGTTPPKEAWRSFLWVQSTDDSDPWGVNRLLDEIPLADAPHTAYKVLSTLLTLRDGTENL